MNKKKIFVAILAVIIGILTGVGFYETNKDKSTEEIVGEAVNEVQDYINTTNVTLSDETKEIVNETIEAINNNEDLSTKEIPESTEEEEQEITDEGALENDAVVEQENISYDGDSTGNGLSLLGSYQGLTYYSQADSRWANVIYSSVGDASQTMKSSACRPNFGRNSCKFVQRSYFTNYHGKFSS